MTTETTTKTCPLDICDGSGAVLDFVFDPDSRTYYPAGERPCPHTL